MYQQHFGLHAPLPSAGIARDTRVYARDARLARLRQRIAASLARGNALVLLSGPAGTGKTTLATHAVRTHATRLAFGWIAHAPRRPHDLLEQLLAEFELEPDQAGRASLLQTWQRFLNEMALTETAVCVLVENADELGAGVLRALESLTAADPSGCPGANLILISRAGLTERLRRPELAGLAQRVTANLTLEPLDASGTADYLEFALAACGGRLDEIFEPAAVNALHLQACGVIRVIDNLAEGALALAAERGLTRIGAELVDEVAAELAGLAAPAPAPDELPVLTDAVDPTGDALVRDVMASIEQRHPPADAAPAETAPDAEHATVADADAEDEDEDDAQSESFEGVANALAFEDFSNLVAETVFDRDELDELSQTLAVTGTAFSRKLTGTS